MDRPGRERRRGSLEDAGRYLRVAVVAIAIAVIVAFLVWIVYLVGFIAGLWGDFGR